MGTITSHPSVCRFCAVSCPITVDVEDGRVVRTTGNKESPAYGAFCCSRGRALPDVMNNPNRLLHSLKRGPDGAHQTISSTQALDEIAAQVRSIVERHGPRSVALYFGTYSANYPASTPFAVAFMLALQSNMIFASMTIDQPGKDVGAAMLGGWQAGQQGWFGSDVWMLIGSNPLVSIGAAMPAQNPGKLLTEAIDNGMKFIVIDPRRTQTASRAHIHLQPRPGEDASILAAMIHVIFAEGLEDKAFISENVAGADALRHAVAPFTPAYAAVRADVPAEQIVAAARMFASAKRGVAGGATGANMSGRSTLTEYLILSLNTICGRFLREGDPVANPGVLLTRATPKAQASPPRPAIFPEFKMASRDLCMSASGMPTSALPDEILAGKVKALFVLGGNPAVAWPDQKRTIEGLQALELLVSADIKMSATAQLANYVIAPKLGVEVPNMSYVTEYMELWGGIWAMSVPFGMYAPKITEPPAGSDVIEEWEMFYGLAQRLSLQLKLYYTDTVTSSIRVSRPPLDVDMVNKPTTDDVYDMLTIGSRIPLSEVKKHPNGALFPETILAAPKDPGHTARLDVGNGEMMEELAEVSRETRNVSEEFPYMLICRRSPLSFNSTGRDLPSLVKKGGGTNPAYMHSEDITALGLKSGDVIELASRHGAIPGVVEADDTLRRGLVSMTHAYGDLPKHITDFLTIGSNTSLLTSVEDDYDKYSGMPRMSGLPVRVTPGGWPRNSLPS